MKAEKFGADQQVVLGFVKRFPGSSHNLISWLLLDGGVKDGKAHGYAQHATPVKMVKAMSAYKRLNELVNTGVLVKRAGAAFVVPGTSDDGYWVVGSSATVADGVVTARASDVGAPVAVKQGVSRSAAAKNYIATMSGDLE